MDRLSNRRVEALRRDPFRTVAAKNEGVSSASFLLPTETTTATEPTSLSRSTFLSVRSLPQNVVCLLKDNVFFDNRKGNTDDEEGGEGCALRETRSYTVCLSVRERKNLLCFALLLGFNTILLVRHHHRSSPPAFPPPRNSNSALSSPCMNATTPPTTIAPLVIAATHPPLPLRSSTMTSSGDTS